MIGSAAIFVAVMLAEASTATPDAKDKVTCRREAPIGSLIQSKKTCHTRREWEQIAANGSADADTMRERASPHSTSGSDFTPF